MHVSDFLASSIISPACFFSSSFLFCRLKCLMLVDSLFLCRIIRSCCRVAWRTWLHCPFVDPAKERARTPLTSTLAPQSHCRSAGLTLYPRNSWPIWQRAEGQTCVLSPLTCSVSLGQGSPTTLLGRKPQCEHRCRLWSFCISEIRELHNTDMFKHIWSMDTPCWFTMCIFGLHLSEKPFR